VKVQARRPVKLVNNYSQGRREKRRLDLREKFTEGPSASLRCSTLLSQLRQEERKGKGGGEKKGKREGEGERREAPVDLPPPTPHGQLLLTSPSARRKREKGGGRKEGEKAPYKR